MFLGVILTEMKVLQRDNFYVRSFVRSFVEFALHRGPKVLTHRSGWPGLCVTRRPRLKGEHTRWCASQPSPQIALVTSELERPYLPKAPSHLWLGGLNLYLLTETPTPSVCDRGGVIPLSQEGLH